MRLVDFPERGSLRNELGPGIRVVGFEHRIAIAFVVFDDRVEIVRLLYGGQDLERALG